MTPTSVFDLGRMSHLDLLALWHQAHPDGHHGTDGDPLGPRQQRGTRRRAAHRAPDTRSSSMSSEVTPGSVMTGFWRWAGVGVFALIVLGALIVGGWQAGWWFTNQNASREAHLIRNGYSNQQTLREQITAQIANVDTITTQIAASKDQNLTSALKAQRASIAGIACQDAAGVTGDPLPAQQAQWVTVNCAAGVVRPGSPYYQAGTP